MQQSMFVYNTDWHGSKTFRMVPIDLNCPFNEVIYDPETKVLAVVSKEQNICNKACLFIILIGMVTKPLEWYQ